MSTEELRRGRVKSYVIPQSCIPIYMKFIREVRLSCYSQVYTYIFPICRPIDSLILSLLFIFGSLNW